MAKPNRSTIRRARTLKGIEVGDLSSAVGISYVHMANIENGHNGASVTTLRRIADALGLTMSDVIDPTDPSLTGAV